MNRTGLLIKECKKILGEAKPPRNVTDITVTDDWFDQRDVPYLFVDGSELWMKGEDAYNYQILPNDRNLWKKYYNRAKKANQDTRTRLGMGSDDDEEAIEIISSFVSRWQKAFSGYDQIWNQYRNSIEDLDDKFRVVKEPFIYRALTVSDSQASLLEDGKTIGLEPRSVTSWSTSRQQAEKVAKQMGSGKKVIVIKMKTPSVNKIALSLVSPALKGRYSQEGEVILRGNGIDRISLSDVSFYNF